MHLTSALNILCFVAVLLLACSVCTLAFAQTAVDLQLVLAVDAPVQRGADKLIMPFGGRRKIGCI
jgi:hypothetical protein